MWRLFKNNNQIHPEATAKKESGLKRLLNNFIADEDYETFYLCLRAPADFFIQEILPQWAKSIMAVKAGLSDNKKQIEQIQTSIKELQKELKDSDNWYSDPHMTNQLKRLIKDNERALESLTHQKTELEQMQSYISVDAYQGDAENALLFASEAYFVEQSAYLANNPDLKISPPDFVLFEIKIPHEKLNHDTIGSKEITRPDLFEYIKSVKSISKDDTKKIMDARLKSSEIDQQILDDSVSNATDKTDLYQEVRRQALGIGSTPRRR